MNLFERNPYARSDALGIDFPPQNTHAREWELHHPHLDHQHVDRDLEFLIQRYVELKQIIVERQVNVLGSHEERTLWEDFVTIYFRLECYASWMKAQRNRVVNAHLSRVYAVYEVDDKIKTEEFFISLIDWPAGLFVGPAKMRQELRKDLKENMYAEFSVYMRPLLKPGFEHRKIDVHRVIPIGDLAWWPL